MKSTSFPTLSTERLLLRQIQQDDLQNIFHGLSNPDVIQTMGFVLPVWKRQQHKWRGLKI